MALRREQRTTEWVRLSSLVVNEHSLVVNEHKEILLYLLVIYFNGNLFRHFQMLWPLLSHYRRTSFKTHIVTVVISL
jgi:hypothetical protein